MKELPEGWTTEDIEYLIGKSEDRVVLVADTRLGAPTIHEMRGAEHLGFGLFRVREADYELHFDAGGAMQRTPSGKGWTYVSFRGDYDTYRPVEKKMQEKSATALKSLLC